MSEHLTEKQPIACGLWQPDEIYKAAISVLSEGIVILTSDGIQESNASAQKILGLDKDGQGSCFSEHPTNELYYVDGSPLKREDHPCMVTLATGEAFSNAIVGIRRPGCAITWCSINTRPIWTTQGGRPDSIVASIRDITLEVEAQTQLEHARQVAESRSVELEEKHKRLEIALSELHQERELRETFVANLSHDLRTPLSVAIHSSQKLLNEIEPSNPSHKRVERIFASVKRLDLMIRDLLDANRLQAGQGLPLNKKLCHLQGVIEQACDGLFDQTDRRIVKKINENVDVIACSNSLNRVLENLIGNALKYGSEKSPVTVSLSKSERSAFIEVHNFGEPIPEDEQETLFEPYRRSASVVKRNAHGWGLGLALVKGIVEAHNGRVTLKSSPGSGTTFRIELPLMDQ